MTSFALGSKTNDVTNENERQLDVKKTFDVKICIELVKKIEKNSRFNIISDCFD